MKKTVQIFSLLLILWSFVAGLLFIAVPLAILHAFYFIGFELIVAAILIDGYYQAFYSFPWLSVSTIGLVFLIDFIKPQLLMYTEQNEMVS